MKKGFLVIVFALSLLMVIGCAGMGLNTQKTIQNTSIYAASLILKNNPSYKPKVLDSMNLIKAELNNNLTYSELTAFIVKQLPEQYAEIGDALCAILDGDTPTIENVVPMTPAYKAGVSVVIDKFIALASR